MWEQESPSISLIEPEKSLITSGRQTEYTALVAGIFILVYIVVMMAAPFLMVWLYKCGRGNIIKAWLMIAVFSVFFYVGGVYIFDFFRSRCIKIDWVTLVLCVWNFSITGLFAVFGRVPLVINQAYLIVMSSLMAYIFQTFPSFAIWVILGILVVWDLFAALSPWGPPHMLVSAVGERGDELPALVYDINSAHSGRESNLSPSKVSTIDGDAKMGTVHLQSNLPAPTSVNRHIAEVPSPEMASTAQGVSSNLGSHTHSPTVLVEKTLRRSTDENVEKPLGDPAPVVQNPNGEIQVGVISTHLKLSLANFSFSFFLVTLALRSGPMTTLASTVAILTGLCSTLILVTVMKRALPALQISIGLGMIAYFLTQYALVPYVENFFPQLIFY